MEQIEEKRRNLAFGEFGEKLAGEYYISKGYALLERNWHSGRSEIDLIVQKENVIAFVEVKARSGKDQDALDAVTFDKIKRMVRGAHSYLRKQKGDLNYRFDIVAVTGNFNDYNLEVVEDAFVAPLI